MRRTVVCAWLPAAVLCLSEWSTGACPAAPLKVATFRCDVTPPLGAAIYSGYKPLATVEHPLLAKGIVLDDGRRRYVLCAVDWCELCNSTHTLFRRKMAEAAGTETSLAWPCRRSTSTRRRWATATPSGCWSRSTTRRRTSILSSSTRWPTGWPRRSRNRSARLEPFDRDRDRPGQGRAGGLQPPRADRRRQDPRALELVHATPTLRAEPEGYIDPC